MFNIQTFNNIAKEGLQVFDIEKYLIDGNQPPDGYLLRSQNLHEITIPESIKAIARAGAGVNNIPTTDCAERGVIVFNTPGANANAVKELVLAGLFLSARPIIEGNQWINQLESEDIEKKVEAGKKAFAGTELAGKKLGIIGLGAIGALVANDALHLGMDVVGYDPFVSVDTAWRISKEVTRAITLEEVLATCDYITVHVPLMENTKEMFNEETLQLLKSNAVLLNFSRGELVDKKAVKALLDEGSFRLYMTDFATPELIKHPNVRVFPHLGASTEEAEINCAKMAAKELKQYLETGNIQNAVNYPNVDMPYKGLPRISICHKNIPNMVGQITTELAKNTFNIIDMRNSSKGDYAYTLIDLDEANTKADLRDIKRELSAIQGVLRVRILEPVKTYV